ncbi:ABC transporter permease [Pseudomarimonas arenosa]|uniref:ABC transporter permease n=1 Tax=Pseudomarimonas arenosa TaxID=2774145 RepID=A0AAW3ZP71_9GAMM|nr:ABC transporter permease [Pseudomarimonas arenosa]MBD8526892.1 ABC transporter permease [Pseudomarimonas arenosa]
MHLSSNPAVGFATVLHVELFKLRRSLALLLALIAPSLIALFVFFNLLRMEKPMAWSMSLQSSAAIWAFFMLPMSVTALTALVAQMEHSARSWDGLHSLPLPRWQLYAAKLICVLGLVLAMSLCLAILTPLAVALASQFNPAAAASGALEMAPYLGLLGRIFLAAWLVIAVQLWMALRFSSFVPALALGIGGTFFAVVATSAKVGALMPWQIPVNQLAADPARADFSLALGFLGGCLILAMMLRQLARREWLG